jgi:hypothetical protein
MGSISDPKSIGTTLIAQGMTLIIAGHAMQSTLGHMV